MQYNTGALRYEISNYCIGQESGIRYSILNIQSGMGQIQNGKENLQMRIIVLNDKMNERRPPCSMLLKKPYLTMSPLGIS